MFDEPKGKVVEKKKQTNDTDDFPEGRADEWQPPLEKKQEPKSDVPLHDNLPNAWIEEWQPSFDTKTNIKPVEIQKPAMQEKKPAPMPIFRLLGFSVIILFLIILGVSNYNYYAHLPKTPAPSPIAQATSASKLSTATSVVPKPTLGIGSTMFLIQRWHEASLCACWKFSDGFKRCGYFLAYPDEKPQHTVFLDAFWIDQTDVANAMYAQCVSSGHASHRQKSILSAVLFIMAILNLIIIL